MTLLLFLAACSNGVEPGPSYQGPIIDTHEHLQGPEQIEDMFSAMDANNVQTIWLVGRGERYYRKTDLPELATLEGNNSFILRLVKQYPNKIRAFPRIRLGSQTDIPAAVDNYISQGASGIKIHFGSKTPRPGRPFAADEPYMTLYKYCESKNIPVMIHIEEHAQPGQIDKIAAACPNLKLIICHIGHAPDQPDLWDDLLSRHPNLYTELSFGFESTYAERVVKLSENISRWREVVLAHPGQFLFGTDMVITPRSNRTRSWIEGRFRAYRDIYELPEFKDTLVGAKQTWELDVKGQNLPQDALKRIYWDNPNRIVSQ